MGTVGQITIHIPWSGLCNQSVSVDIEVRIKYYRFIIGPNDLGINKIRFHLKNSAYTTILQIEMARVRDNE